MDALTLDDGPSEATEASKARKKRKPRIQNSDIPLVKDAVGESVADTFENFLRTYVVILRAWPGLTIMVV
jgi:DNA replication licensing factor MCM6